MRLSRAAKIVHDLDEPDGTPRKLMGADRIRAMGWHAKIDLESDVQRTYESFLESKAASPRGE